MDRTYLSHIHGNNRLFIRLSPKQMQIAREIAAGKCNADVAYAVGLTVNSLRVALHRIYRRLHCEGDNSRLLLALWFLGRKYE